MTIPYTFAGATTAIPLAQLDANFASPITLGNVAMTLSNTYNSIGNLTLTNVTISSASGLAANTVAYANASGVLGGSANMTFNGTTLTLANDASISGLTVGKGGGAVSTNTAVGNGAGNATNTGGYSTFLGYQTGYNNTSGINCFIGALTGFTNSTGTYNVFVGNGDYPAGYYNTTGSNNTAIGGAALKSNTTASYNTAVGYQAGYSNVTGELNAFFGRLAGYNSTGAGNTFIGGNAGYNSTGTNNTFVGANLGGTGCGQYMTTGSKNTILGAFSGNQGGLNISTSSNYIVLSDGDGNPRVSIPTGTATATIPNATGTVMVSGAMPAFNVYANTNQTISNATVTKVALQARTFDTASAFDITTNYRFQPLVAGYYQLNGQVQYTGTVVAYNALIFYKNGSEVARGALGGSATTYGASGSCLVYLNGSTDYMEMYVQQNSGGNLTLNSTSFYVQFSGAMVRAA